MRKIGKIELVPNRRFYTHAEWCQHLWIRNSLAQPHMRCRLTDHCVASAHSRSETEWRHA